MIYLFLLTLGAIVGSFVVASVWRLRYDQLSNSLVKLSKSEKNELSRLKKIGYQQNIKDNRSRCLNCGHDLSWFDLLPIVSWLSLGGKCRYCNKKIGWTEFFAEIVMSILFVVFYALTKDSLTPLQFSLWLGMLTMLAIIFIYDLKWSLMPTKILYLAIVWSIIYAFASWRTISGNVLIEYGASLLTLAGIYASLSLISNEKWIGWGDSILGVALAFMLGDWKLSLASLFFANFIGTIIILPSLLLKKINRNQQIPLGPFLIIGFLIVFLTKNMIKNWLSYFY